MDGDGGLGLVEAAIALAAAAPLETSGETVVEPSSSSSSDGILSFSNLSDAYDELAVPKAVRLPLLPPSPPNAGGRRRRKKKRYDEYVTTHELGFLGSSSFTEGGSEAEASTRRSSQAVKPPVPKPKGFKGSIGKRKRIITLNYPPDEYLERVAEHQYVLHGGRSVAVRKSDLDPLIGVDQAMSSKYRARFKSTYLGRFPSREEAARAHDTAAIMHLIKEAEGEEAVGDARVAGTALRQKKRAKVEVEGMIKKKKKAGRPKKKIRKVPPNPMMAVTAEVRHKAKGIIPSWLVSDVNDIFFLDRIDFVGRQCITSCECSLVLQKRDACLSSTTLTFELPRRCVEELSKHTGSSQPLVTEIVDEMDDARLLLTGHFMAVQSEDAGWTGFLRLEGKWGQYARSRLFAAGDAISMLFTFHTKKLPRLTKSFALAPDKEVSVFARLSVTRNAIPPQITILEPNVESEIGSKELGFVYVPGRLRKGAVSDALRRMKSFDDLSTILKSKLDDAITVNHRMRVAAVSPEKGHGIWLLEEVTRGEVLFEYGGLEVSEECVHQSSAYFLNNVDATHFGNVSRFVNQSQDPNLEVVLVHNRILFRAKRKILEGEVLTISH
ncbi:hypothetical protein A3770_08p52350 [Chloropicon primus]|uniref:SET domain-containing protein n=1 Tax=Chloropicon primus TaxID=1764295 RepID=A0A5B8MQP3_9CHLO|nr:hypothetical protein A3770_08p52350 [Chloropicon primus]|eukprot:QDZ22717.1 hypothetical protein A3770_08p52350 [Chloropicon primus]